MLRLSLDAKATIKIGPFSRGGKNRVETEACDHDFSSLPKLIPYGILLAELPFNKWVGRVEGGY